MKKPHKKYYKKPPTKEEQANYDDGYSAGLYEESFDTSRGFGYSEGYDKGNFQRYNPERS